MGDTSTLLGVVVVVVDSGSVYGRAAHDAENRHAYVQRSYLPLLAHTHLTRVVPDQTRYRDIGGQVPDQLGLNKPGLNSAMSREERDCDSWFPLLRGVGVCVCASHSHPLTPAQLDPYTPPLFDRLFFYCISSGLGWHFCSFFAVLAMRRRGEGGSGTRGTRATGFTGRVVLV